MTTTNGHRPITQFAAVELATTRAVTTRLMVKAGVVELLTIDPSTGAIVDQPPTLVGEDEIRALIGDLYALLKIIDTSTWHNAALN